MQTGDSEEGKTVQERYRRATGEAGESVVWYAGLKVSDGWRADGTRAAWNLEAGGVRPIGQQWSGGNEASPGCVLWLIGSTDGRACASSARTVGETGLGVKKREKGRSSSLTRAVNGRQACYDIESRQPEINGGFFTQCTVHDVRCTFLYSLDVV